MFLHLYQVSICMSKDSHHVVRFSAQNQTMTSYSLEKYRVYSVKNDIVIHIGDR